MGFILRPVRVLGRVTLAGRLAQSGRFSMLLLEIIRGLPEVADLVAPDFLTEACNIGVGSLFIVAAHRRRSPAR